MQPFNNATKAFFILSMCLFSTALFSQKIKLLESGKRVSIRGLSVVDDNTVWVSGSSGSVAKSTDGGKTWNWMVIPGYEKRDFRDVEAFDANTAIIIAVAEPAVILKTEDGGQNWKKVFEDTTKGMFLDAMYFSDINHGIVIGDPVGPSAFIANTYSGGNFWKKRDRGEDTQYDLNEGEAFFASSGTNFFFTDDHHPILVSGGKSSRLFMHGKKYPLPIIQGKESTGANSIAVYNGKKAVVVGGDFAKDTLTLDNCVLFDISNDIRFTKPETPPHGYRSCVIYLSKNKLLTCGTSGIDISKDGGRNWELISKESFHVCQKAKKGKAVFLAGGGGRIARLEE
jgi:hypothetical protein